MSSSAVRLVRNRIGGMAPEVWRTQLTSSTPLVSGNCQSTTSRSKACSRNARSKAAPVA